jgi:4-hydroxythreonine-4-phosphate dehydrogenase
MVRYIKEGVRLCQAGLLQGLVTAPISKEALRAGGYPDTGHTTMLARLTGTPRPVMMLAGPKLRVILVTIHRALREVPDLISAEGIVETASVAHRDLRRYLNLARPRLAVAALNPHAGEGGLFGDEEGRIIAPAVEELKRRGVEASGPYPPDTVFWHMMQGAFDAVICMYHDQGLIPFKLRHFDNGVNVTLGLPIIRTSPDHGTAYDIAGQGKASPASMKAAVLMAADMAAKSAGAGA